MRLRILLAILAGWAQFASAQKTVWTSALITFEKTLHDFGRVLEGPHAEYAFEFQNTGDHPLFIQDCRTSDPHTASWPKEPILPGKRGKIVVSMPTQSRAGPFEKSVRVIFNAVNARRYGQDVQGETTLSIKGFVEHDSARVGLLVIGRFIAFDTVEADGIITRSVPCTNVGKLPVQILSFEWPDIHCDARDTAIFRFRYDRDIIYPGETMMLHLTLDARYTKLGTLSTYIHLRFGDCSGHGLHVSGWVRQRTAAPPPRAQARHR